MDVVTASFPSRYQHMINLFLAILKVKGLRFVCLGTKGQVIDIFVPDNEIDEIVRLSRASGALVEVPNVRDV